MYELRTMGKFHVLKILPQFFREVQSGQKKFEVRLNDRGFQVGDVLRLKLYDSGNWVVPAEWIDVVVTSLLRLQETPWFPVLSEPWVVMSIRKLPRV